MTVTDALDDRSARHLDRVIAEIIADRPPVECAVARLIAAADLGELLDRQGVAL